MFIDGKEIFSSVKTKNTQTAYPSVKDFLMNDGKQFEPDSGGEFLEVPLTDIFLQMIKVIPLGARLSPLLAFFRHTSQISSAGECHSCLLNLYCPTTNPAAWLYNNYCEVLP